MKRSDVYAAIDTERVHQDGIWEELNNTIDNPSSYILWMERYLHNARELASTQDERMGTSGNTEIMDVLRKVIALGVAFAEKNGIPCRKEV